MFGPLTRVLIGDAQPNTAGGLRRAALYKRGENLYIFQKLVLLLNFRFKIRAERK